MGFSSTAHPTQIECAPIMSRQINLSCILRVFAAVLIALTMSPLVTYVHAFLRQTSQSIYPSVPLLVRIWCTLRARDFAAPLLPVDLCFKVCPVLIFLWFEILVLSLPQEVCSVFHA